MTSKQKIAEVLEEIKEKSDISLDSKSVMIEFYPDMVIAGSCDDKDKKDILLKLQHEKIIKIKLPDERGGIENGQLSVYAPEEFMLNSECKGIRVEILKDFSRKYWFCRIFCLKNIDYWNLVNPFWWIWKMILLIGNLIIFIWKHKIPSFILAIASLMALNYSIVWQNFNNILNFIKKLI